jgi:hypothetical protein
MTAVIGLSARRPYRGRLRENRSAIRVSRGSLACLSPSAGSEASACPTASEDAHAVAGRIAGYIGITGDH